VCDRSQVVLTAGVFTLDGTRALRVEERGADASALGEAAAHRLLALGAGEILDSFNRIARLDPPLVPGVTP